MPASSRNMKEAGSSSSSPSSLPPPMDFSSYPPCFVVWTYTAVDTVCEYGSAISPQFMDCTKWRDSLPASWTTTVTTAKTKNNDDGAEVYVPWLSPSNKYPGPVRELLPPLTTYEEFLTAKSSADAIPSSSSQPTILSTAATMWEFAQTPSTTLADLTSGSSFVVLIGLVWLMRRVKATLIPFFSSLGKKAALHTHGEEWCTQPSNQIRITKFGEYVFRLCFHSVISTAGIVLFWESPWWADVVGTKAEDDTIVGTPTLFLDFPFQPILPSMIWYYLIQGAYNVEAMISLLELSFDVRFQSPVGTTSASTTSTASNNNSNGTSSTIRLRSPIGIKWSDTARGDFREMFIHHVVTNLLIFGSSFIRMTRVGSMVFIVHDLSDVPVDLSKLANFLKWKTTTVLCFVSMNIVWLMTRLYTLPFIIFRSVVTESWLVCANGYVHPIYWVMYRPPFIILMGLLILLHLIWFSMFIQMGYVLVSKGEAHDLSEHKKGEQVSGSGSSSKKES